MTPIPNLFAWLAGRPIPPPVPLCIDACGRAADTSDGSPRCVPCQLRVLHLAARPDLFPDDVVAEAAQAHADVLVIGSEAVDSHMHVTQRGLLVHEYHRLAWRWDVNWPDDDRTIEDILEAASLERLWGRGRSS